MMRSTLLQGLCFVFVVQPATPLLLFCPLQIQQNAASIKSGTERIRPPPPPTSP